jgi:tRNA (guanine-N7-)-methyltransferase
MVSPAMRRYRRRTPQQAAFIGNTSDPVNPTEVFGRHAPLRLEVGFGHGEFIRQLAATHPDEDHIGIEFNPLRVTKTAHKCQQNGLYNVKLYQGDAEGFVRNRMPPASCHRQYILFSDPWPRKRHRRRRLMNRSCLFVMARIAPPGCKLMIATDSHNYGMQALSCCSMLAELWRPLYPNGYRFDIPTRFTTVFQRHKVSEGHSICYVHMERSTTAAPAPVPLPRSSQAGQHLASDQEDISDQKGIRE